MAKQILNGELWQIIEPLIPKKTKIPTPRSKIDLRLGCSQRDPFRPQDRNCLGRPAFGNGLRIRYDLLASPARLAEGRCMGTNPPGIAEQIKTGRPN